MVVVGTDAHKYSHTFVATDETQTDGGNSNRRNIDRPHQRPRTTHTQTDGGNSN